MFKRSLALLALTAALVSPAYAQFDVDMGGGFGGGFGPGGGFSGGFGGSVTGPGGFSGEFGGGFGPGGFTGGFTGGFGPGGFPGGFPGGGFPGMPPGGFRNPGAPYEGRLPPTATTSVDFDITECSWCGQGGYAISNQDFYDLNQSLSQQTIKPFGGNSKPGDVNPLQPYPGFDPGGSGPGGFPGSGPGGGQGPFPGQ